MTYVLQNLLALVHRSNLSVEKVVLSVLGLLPTESKAPGTLLLKVLAQVDPTSVPFNTGTLCALQCSEIKMLTNIYQLVTLEMFYGKKLFQNSMAGERVNLMHLLRLKLSWLGIICQH